MNTGRIMPLSGLPTGYHRQGDRPMKRKSKVKGDFSRIPKQEHARIREMMGWDVYKGKTPLAIWRGLLKHWKQQAKQAEAERLAQEKKVREMEEHRRQMKLDRIGEAISNVAMIRDLLENMERGEFGGGGAETDAMFANSALKLNMRALEAELIDMGLLPKEAKRKAKKESYGCFQED